MRRIYIECPIGDLEGTVDDDADLDSVFVITTDEGEQFNVNGWQCDISEE